MKRYTLKLTSPIGGGEITELIIHEPTYKQLRGLSPLFVQGTPDFDVAMDYLTLLTGHEAGKLDDMSPKDVLNACHILAGVTGGGVEAINDIVKGLVFSLEWSASEVDEMYVSDLHHWYSLAVQHQKEQKARRES